MRAKILTAKLCFVFSFSFFTLAHSEDGDKKIYLGIEAGESFVAKNFPKQSEYNGKKPKNSTVVGIGFGYQVNKSFVAEINYYQFTNHRFKKIINNSSRRQDIKSHALVFNGNLNLPVSYNILTPFLTAGFGYVNNDVGDYINITAKDRVLGKSNQGLAWNVGAGINAEITREILMSLTYRYFDLGKIETQPLYVENNSINVSHVDPITAKLRLHSAMIGIKYKF